MEIISNLKKINGHTHHLCNTLQSIHAGGLVTCWDEEDERFGKLYFVYDVRTHSDDLPKAGKGIVITPYLKESRDVLNRYRRYPKGAYPFSQINAEIINPIDTWAKVVQFTSVDKPGLLDPSLRENIPYDAKEFVEEIEKYVYINGTLSVSAIAAALRDYASWYLHTQHWSSFYLSLWPSEIDYSIASTFKTKTFTTKKKQNSLFENNIEHLNLNTIAIFMGETLEHTLIIDDLWKETIRNFIEYCQKEGFFQNPTR